MKFTNLLFSVLMVSFGACACSSETGSTTVTDGDYVYFPLPTDLTTNVITTEDQNFIVQQVVTGLRSPWGMAFLPDGSMLITERGGTLRRVVDGQLLNDPVGNVPAVFARGQGGLLDVALHPEYKSNGWIYLSYSELGDDGSHTAIMRAKLEGNNLVQNEVIFRGSPKSTRGHHFGSRIAFDNDGYLFFTIGDRGQRDDSQLLDTYAGKSFRINDDGSIPADNPFVGQAGANPEIFTYGNRNQQGLVKHPFTGEMWAHEHGPRGGDEVNILRAGNNYGWPVISFGINYDGTIITSDTARTGMEQPVNYWLPSIGASGMTFVTGDTYSGWTGENLTLLSGSLALQFLQRSVYNGETLVKEEKLLEGIGRVRDVRQAPDGYIYLATESDGTIHRLIPVN
jgi:aldose sugar dehydrogenase